MVRRGIDVTDSEVRVDSVLPIPKCNDNYSCHLLLLCAYSGIPEFTVLGGDLMYAYNDLFSEVSDHLLATTTQYVLPCLMVGEKGSKW